MNELSTRREHARDLAQCGVGLIDVITGPEVDDNVKRCVFERKIAGIADVQFGGDPKVRDTGFRDLDERCVDVDAHQP